MFAHLISRFFPVPKFLAMPSYGLDISDESMKFVELVPKRKGFVVGKYGEKKIPIGLIESGKIVDSKKLQDILSALRKEEQIDSVRVSVPEEQVYLFKLHLEKADLENVADAIEISLEEHIPIPAVDAIFDYEVISEDEQSVEVEVVAAPKLFIEDYFAIFHNSGIRVRSLELEGTAIARAVIKNGDLDTYMIVDFGEKRTGIFIISRGVAVFTSTLDVSGMMLNNMIMKTFKVSPAEAEKMKREYGLQRNVENKEIFPVLLNSVSILRDEIVKHSIYWNTHTDEQGKKNPPIKGIILSGGGSNLIGLSEYLSVSTRTNVDLADVWTNIIDIKKYTPDISFKESLSFASALGLALGDLKEGNPTKNK